MSSSRQHTTRTKPRKNCGPQLVDRVKKLTDELYDLCDLEARETFGDYDTAEDFGRWFADIRKQASILYQERIIKFSTSDLEDILWVHQNGLYKRAPYTVQNITSELATRQLLESDNEK